VTNPNLIERVARAIEDSSNGLISEADARIAAQAAIAACEEWEREQKEGPQDIPGLRWEVGQETIDAIEQMEEEQRAAFMRLRNTFFGAPPQESDAETPPLSEIKD